MKNKILTILGTRPELIKMFQVIKKLDKYFDNELIWSGQHYDFELVENIFKDVGLRKPNQIIKINKKKNNFFQIQEKIYNIIKKSKPKAIVYHGDTFTTLATSLVSNFFFPNIKRIHIEGGYRSNDLNQIEEKARKASDQFSNIIFTQRLEDKKNLYNENIKQNIYVVGNSIYESVQDILKNLNHENLNKKYDFLIRQKFVLTTIHREENVENKIRFRKILNIINNLSKNYLVFFPIHPRTKKKISALKIKLNSNVVLKSPISYSETIFLLSKSLFCFTDSGGLQEESVILKKRCLVPSNKTPHSYYLHKYANNLILIDNKNYMSGLKNFKNSMNKNIIKSFYHKKNTSSTIIKILKEIL
tara:strand:- start:2601 stop:3680 length:1080 start_codon:yes stop_codon:yes gene_type:complete